MNPCVNPFQPEATTPVLMPDDFRNLNKSLCKALAEERQAHRSTKQALINEIEKRTQSENEIKSLVETNKSLAATAHMLGDIVKHNINNPETSECDQVRSLPLSQ